MFIVLTITLISFIIFKFNNVPTSINGEVVVVDLNKYSNSYLYTVKYKSYKFTFFSNEKYEMGQYLYLKGDIKRFDHQRVPGGFNEYQYNLNKGIYGKVNVTKTTTLNKFNYLYKYTYKAFEIDDKYLNAFFGNNQFDSDYKDILKNLNILSFFSISGLHINVLLFFINKIYLKTNFSIKKQNIHKITLFGLLLYLSNYSFTILRFFIVSIIKTILYKLNVEATNFTITNLGFLLILLMFPFLINNIYYLNSILIVNILILFSSFYQDRSFLVKSIIISFIINITLIPLNNKVNIFSILTSPIFITLICFVIFPLSIVTFFLPNIRPLTNQVYNVFDRFITSFDNVKLNYYITTFNFIYLLLIILLVYLVFKYFNKIKQVLSIILLLLIALIPTIIKYNNEPSLYFLDVGQGDSSVFISKDMVIVIDAYNNVGNFLIHKGINKIDYLILTHNHLDHIKEANSLISNFNVKNIIVSKTDNKYNFDYNNSVIIEASSDYLIKSDNIQVKFLAPIKEYKNENNNSLVFKLEYNNTKVLFTGDIELEAENDIIDKYDYLLKSDVLKVAHHGSNTSSSYEFLSLVNPNYAIISVASDNIYNLPSIDVINRLNILGIKTYQTKSSNTIVYYQNKIS